ncbi:Hsp20/alpha crystallin family protein [Ramlibacter rhizophilus]|uniref:Hsp20/alpha crystallin family protein n=1 Tax=Ramlibacter rhizophilus TaxID=1781167 RepID=A0A4Z0BH47_9BURK|nr:Hsp20/alpha crystallin family protein [Ramlibacter rhizophilus]TFY97793.1 Hsp20/alpha crystallin family protein [Ramlibacter rhizophilus]
MMSRFVVPFGTGSRAQGAGDPFNELHHAMNRLFDDFLVGGATPTGAQSQGAPMAVPRLDVREGDKEIAICAELAGVKPSDVDLRIEGNVITLRGEKKNEAQQEREDYHVMERSFGRFQRSIQLPFAPDPEQVRASFEHGVLTVRVPKPVQQERSRRIEIQGAAPENDKGRILDAPSQEPATEAQDKSADATRH